MRKLEDGTLRIGDRIARIKFDLACDYDEIPFTDPDGCLFTREFYLQGVPDLSFIK